MPRNEKAVRKTPKICNRSWLILKTENCSRSARSGVLQILVFRTVSPARYFLKNKGFLQESHALPMPGPSPEFGSELGGNAYAGVIVCVWANGWQQTYNRSQPETDFSGRGGLPLQI